MKEMGWLKKENIFSDMLKDIGRENSKQYTLEIVNIQPNNKNWVEIVVNVCDGILQTENTKKNQL